MESSAYPQIPDLNFPIAANFVVDVNPDIYPSSLQPVAEIFRENLLRLHSLAGFPTIWAWFAMEYSRIWQEACQATGEIWDHPGRLGGSRANAMGEFVRRLGEESTIWGPLGSVLVNELMPHAMTRQAGTEIEKRFKNDCFDAMESLLSSIVVGAWTAFEALAADLWKAAVNADPELGLAALGAEPAPTDDETEIERKEKLKFGFHLEKLRKHDFNLKNKMGTLLAGSTKWNFAKHESVHDAYVKAFGIEAKDALDSVFKSSQMWILRTLRNVIVHNAGRADEKFCLAVKSDSQFKQVKPGDRIPINGGYAFFAANTAANMGTTLLDIAKTRLEME